MVFWFILKNSMFPIFFLVLLGYWLDKRFKLPPAILSKYLMYIIVPSFILVNVYHLQFSANSKVGLISVILFMVISFLYATLIGKVRHYDLGMVEACRNALMFNNTGNLGFSLINLVFAHEPFLVDGQTPYLKAALSAHMIYYIVQSITLNSICLYQAGRGKATVKQTLKVIFHMPMLYAIALGFLCRQWPLPLEEFFLYPVINLCSKSLLPLAMIIMGIQLSRTKIQWLDKDVWIVNIFKVLVLPATALIMIYGGNALFPGSFTPITSLVFLLYSSIPTAVNTSVFALEFDNHPDYATQTVMNSTVLSAFSMTFYIFLGKLLFL